MGRNKGSKNTGVKWDEENLKNLANKLDEWIQVPTHFWIKDFLIEHKIPKQYLPKMFETSEQLKKSYELAQMIQESKIVKAAMGRKIDSTFAIFTLKNVAGWRDTPLVEINNNINHKLMIFRNEKSIKEDSQNEKSVTSSILRESGEERSAAN